jgi:hypothetical protein
MTNAPDDSNDILVDPARYNLDAAWVHEASAWTRVVVRLLNCVRHQTAAIGISAIVGLLWLAGARAQDASLVFAAIGSIVVITVAAEWMDGKNDEQSRGKGEA